MSEYEPHNIEPHTSVSMTCPGDQAEFDFVRFRMVQSSVYSLVAHTGFLTHSDASDRWRHEQNVYAYERATSRTHGEMS